MNWQTLLQSIGIFAVGSGLLTWLIQSLAKQALDRDLEAFQHGLRKAHEMEMEEAKNRFTVGATSHMANVAFDKHAAFCEEYGAEVIKTLETLFSKGPHEVALECAAALYGVRKKWVVWLTPELETELEKFEAALRTIGVNAQILRMDPGDPESITEMFKQFANVFGTKYGFKRWNGEQVTAGYAIEFTIAGLRAVLGTAELTRLRGELVERASENLG
jgi:hypothetical protein